MLNLEQQSVCQELLSWYEKKAFKECVLRGAAGTGKTYTLCAFLNQLKIRTQLLAPFNKAVGVLKQSLPKELSTSVTISTVHTFLGIYLAESEVGYLILKGNRISKTGEYQELQAENTIDETINLIIVDESSTLNKDLEDKIRNVSWSINAKIIWVGDPFQLPSVKTEPSKILDSCKIKFELTQIQRYSAGSLLVADFFRQRVCNPSLPRPTIEQVLKAQKECEYENVAHLTPETFQSTLKECLKNNKDFRLLAYKNDTVIKLNHLCREFLGYKEPFNKGENLLTMLRITLSEYKKGKNYQHILNNGDTIKICSKPVKDVFRLCDPFPDEGIDIYNPEVLTEFIFNFSYKVNKVLPAYSFEVKHNNKEFNLKIIDPSHTELAIKETNKANICKEDFKLISNVLYYLQGKSKNPLPEVKSIAETLWEYLKNNNLELFDLETKTKSVYRALKEWESVLFLTLHLNYTYSSTVHRSQGSTYDYAFICFDEILASPQWRRLMYVAITRAKTQNYLF